jgi:hypothetical protein
MKLVKRGMAITLAALGLTGGTLAAPGETVLYSFASVSDGVKPEGLIADKQGAFYGTTVGGGSSSNGRVFS